MVACFLEVVFSLQLVNLLMSIVNNDVISTPLHTSPKNLLPLPIHCKKYSIFFYFFFSNIAHIDSSNVVLITYKAICELVYFFPFFSNKVSNLLVKLFGIPKTALSHPLLITSYTSIFDYG